LLIIGFTAKISFKSGNAYICTSIKFMKRGLLYFSFLLLWFNYACNSADSSAQTAPSNVEKDSVNFTEVQWLDSNVNFGSVTKGEKVHIAFHCKNIGNKPMFIYYVRPGCGCTVADYTKAAIPPGSTGEVNAEFDSNHGSSGQVRKMITVKTNTINRSPTLVFFGTVTPPDSTKKSS
jgi:hypothetical protein